ncbi:hypothetical protein [Pareuzebyella sediminis]|uniref:hypothetical protein n=1 Tax=Pareuzebyella sediminis TaxID=2607998 RepID=UPI0011ED34AB|nr:hypothetical protein [Pareuzebyella sediminis]
MGNNKALRRPSKIWIGLRGSNYEGKTCDLIDHMGKASSWLAIMSQHLRITVNPISPRLPRDAVPGAKLF